MSTLGKKEKRVNEYYILLVPMALMCLDLVSGYAAAMHNGEVNSTVMRDGLWNKLSEVLAIVLGKATEFAITVFGADEVGITTTVPVCNAVCVFITVYELVSVIENIGKMNPAIGSALVRILGIDPDKVGLGGDDVR